MTIIKPGHYLEYEYHGLCPTCGCEFIAEESDFVCKTAEPFAEDFHFYAVVYCPTCGLEITRDGLTREIKRKKVEMG